MGQAQEEKKKQLRPPRSLLPVIFDRPKPNQPKLDLSTWLTPLLSRHFLTTHSSSTQTPPPNNQHSPPYLHSFGGFSFLLLIRSCVATSDHPDGFSILQSPSTARPPSSTSFTPSQHPSSPDPDSIHYLRLPCSTCPLLLRRWPARSVAVAVAGRRIFPWFVRSPPSVSSPSSPILDGDLRASIAKRADSLQSSPETFS